jgi:hypothetical protein
MSDVVLADVRKMSSQERSEAQMRVSMQNPEHLKSWLVASGRRWLVINALELVDALPWPAGVDAFLQIVAAYRDHRGAMPSGRMEVIAHPNGESITVPVMKGETLEVEELDRAIRYLIGQITEKDSTWKLENLPM